MARRRGISVVAANASADPRCTEALALRGAVAEVVIRHGHADLATGAERGTPNIWERWAVSDDRRTVTVVQYATDPGSTGLPTTVCEFDVAGRLRHTVLRLDGVTPFTTVDYTYDAEGRRTSVRSRSRNPEFSYDHSFIHSGNTESAIYAGGITGTTVTERDGANRVVLERKRRSDGPPEGSRVEYEYGNGNGNGTITIRGRENGRDWVVSRKVDAMGNTTETSSVPLGSRYTYHYSYDARGNWIRRIHATYSARFPAPARGTLEIREITYAR